MNLNFYLEDRTRLKVRILSVDSIISDGPSSTIWETTEKQYWQALKEAIVKISKSKVESGIEDKIKPSLEKARLSEHKLQEAKDFVENLVKRNSE